MKKHETVIQEALSSGQMKELSSALVESVPTDLSFGDAQYWIGHKTELSRKLRGVLVRSTDAENVVKSPIADWEKFYLDIFNIKKDFSDLKVPAKVEGFDRLIVVAQDMTPDMIFEKIKELMPAWKYLDSLDAIKSERSADHDYAVWIRDRVEADEELKNKSAEDLEKEGIQGITLEERLIYELKYVKETGGHLDVDNVTLCAGSRDPGGYVPYVYWSRGRLSVGWCAPGHRCGRLRSRAVVS